MAEQSLQIKRNKNIFSSRQEAVSHLKNLVGRLNDGEIVLCRYFNNKTIQTLVGFETKCETSNPITNEIEVTTSIVYLDSLNEIGNGLYYDVNHTLHVNLGQGLAIDKDDTEAIQVILGKGLEINENNGVEVKIDDKVTNFLCVDEDGMKVVDMDTDVTKTTERILVMGGPLAKQEIQNIFPKDSNNNPYIAKDTNLQDLLFKLFCEEKYPNISSSNSKQGNVTASINAPIINLSNNESVLEVGTYISASTITFDNNSYANLTASTISGLEYGYSTTNDNIRNSSDKSISKIPSYNLVTSSETKMSCNLTGFTKNAFNTIIGTSIITKNDYDLGQVQDGENTIQISITGQPISYMIESIPQVYPCSNIGKTSGTVITTKVNEIKGTTLAPTNNSLKTINGVRYGFYGIITKQQDFKYESNYIRKLTPLKNKTNFIIKGDNVDKVIIALPSSWNAQISEIIDAEQMNNDLFDSSTGYSSEYMLIKVEGVNGYKAEDYQVYTYDPQTIVKINQTIKIK